jgi:large subunit ribosomal protein L25
MSIVLDCQNRVVKGHAVRKLRREGILPAVIYGEKTESKNIQLNLNEFIKVAKIVGKTSTIILKIDNQELTVKIQQVDLHPVKDTFRHIDFIIVK